MESLKFIDFFAGIGGFRRGMELAGHECVGFCEFDKFAVASYTSMHLIAGEQRAYLETLDKKKRQKEILKEEYKNGEWYASDVRGIETGGMPSADCWCFGFPCQDISVAGKQLGFAGHRSSLFFAVTKLIRELPEEDRPKYLFIENVKNLLSVNGGFDFAKVLIELDEIGYDAEWQVLNSKDFGVPQNRERVFIIGHFRGRSERKVFPIQGAIGENCVSIIGHRNGYRRNLQTYFPEGITEALDTCQSGGREFHLAIPIGMTHKAAKEIDIAHTLTAGTPDKKRGNYSPVTEVAVPVEVLGNINPSGTGMNGNIYNAEGLSPTLTTNKGEGSKIAIPVLTPDRANKRQNGRRFKEDGEPMFTLTGQDKHGVMIQTSEDTAIYAVWVEKYNCYMAIRKLTPKECFQLQAWTDDYFEKAEFVNSDSQLYKQAGNGVTVSVIHAIAEQLN